MRCITKPQLEEITSKINNVLIKKNQKYGSSFFITRNKFKESLLIRLTDKILRLENLTKNNDLGNEYIDTLIDIAGYCVLEIFRITNQQQHGESDARL